MNTYLYSVGNPVNLVDIFGLQAQRCSNDNKNEKDKCKKPKNIFKKGKWVAYYLCRLLSKEVDDAQEGGGTSPRAPKPPKQEKTPYTEPYDPPPPPKLTKPDGGSV